MKLAFRAGQDGRAGWRFAFQYDEKVIESLKKRVPSPDRSWDPEAKEWWVAAEYEEELLELFPSFEAFLRQPVLPGMECSA